MNKIADMANKAEGMANKADDMTNKADDMANNAEGMANTVESTTTGVGAVTQYEDKELDVIDQIRCANHFSYKDEGHTKRVVKRQLDKLCDQFQTLSDLIKENLKTMFSKILKKRITKSVACITKNITLEKIRERPEYISETFEENEESGQNKKTNLVKTDVQVYVSDLVTMIDNKYKEIDGDICAEDTKLDDFDDEDDSDEEGDSDDEGDSNYENMSTEDKQKKIKELQTKQKKLQTKDKRITSRLNSLESSLTNKSEPQSEPQSESQSEMMGGKESLENKEVNVVTSFMKTEFLSDTMLLTVAEELFGKKVTIVKSVKKRIELINEIFNNFPKELIDEVQVQFNNLIAENNKQLKDILDEHMKQVTPKFQNTLPPPPQDTKSNESNDPNVKAGGKKRKTRKSIVLQKKKRLTQNRKLRK